MSYKILIAFVKTNKNSNIHIFTSLQRYFQELARNSNDTGWRSTFTKNINFAQYYENFI